MPKYVRWKLACPVYPSYSETFYAELKDIPNLPFELYEPVDMMVDVFESTCVASIKNIHKLVLLQRVIRALKPKYKRMNRLLFWKDDWEEEVSADFNPTKAYVEAMEQFEQLLYNMCKKCFKKGLPNLTFKWGRHCATNNTLALKRVHKVVSNMSYLCVKTPRVYFKQNNKWQLVPIKRLNKIMI